jgi:hypothetical protein
MKILKLILIVFAFAITFPYAQKDSIISDIKIDTSFIIKVNSKLPEFINHYISYAVLYDINDPYFGTIYYTVEIKKNNNEKLIQTIKSESSLYADPLIYDYGYKEESLDEAMAIDINFDGYKDIRFRSGCGANTFAVNQTYNYYIFNPKKNKFEYNEDVSTILNPTPFSDEKIVRNFCKNTFSGSNGTIDEYKWYKNKLVLLRSVNYVVIMGTCKSDTDCKFTRTIEYYENDKVVNSETKIIDITEIPDYHLSYW